MSAGRGRVRDALATLANVESALRAGSVPPADEIDELRRALAAVREALATSAELEAFVSERVASIESALTAPSSDGVPDLLESVAADLDAAAGLFELAARASEGSPVDVSVATLAEQALQLAWTIRSHGVVRVHLRRSETDCSVSCDPHLVARLLVIAVSAVREVAQEVVVRTRVEDDAGVIEVTALAPEDAGAVVTQTRVVRRIAPTQAVLTAAASSAQIGLVVEPGRVLVRCPRVG